MVKTALAIIVLLLAISGLCELIQCIRLALLSPEIKSKNCVLIYLKQGYAPQQLRYFFEKMRWNGEDYTSVIIAVVDELSFSEAISCQEFANRHHIILCSLTDIERVADRYFKGGQNQFLDE